MDKDLEIVVNYQCNRNCLYCDYEFLSPNKKNIDLRHIFKIIKNAAKEGIYNLSIIGGEPTLYEHILEVIYIAKKNNFKEIGLVSNGLLLSDIEYTHNLVKMGMTSISLNLPHYKKEKFEFLTGKIGSFKTILTAINNLVKENVYITAFIVVNRKNYKELKNIVRFYLKLGIRDFVIAYIRYLGKAYEICNLNELKVAMSKTIPYVEEACKFLIKNDIKITLENFLPCVFNNYRFLMSDFYETSNLNIGKMYDVISQKTYDLYTISYRDNIKSDKCKKCLYYNNCVGIPKNYLDVFTDKEFIPIEMIKNGKEYRYKNSF